MRSRSFQSVHVAAIIGLAIALALTISSCKPSNTSKAPADAHGPGDGHDHGTTTKAIDWCPEHRVPESECTQCHPELAAKWKSQPGQWCDEHGVPEAHCYLCHPSIKFPQEQQYLDQLKQNEVKPSSDEQTSPKPAAAPRMATAIYRQNAPHCSTDEALIQLASTQSVDRIGLSIESVRESRSAEMIEAVGEVEFDPTATAAVTSLVSGTLIKWLVNVSESVTRGQTLAYMESLEGATVRADHTLASAQLELAKADLERHQRLYEKELTSLKEYQDAQAAFARAQADHERAASSSQTIGADVAGDGTLIPIRAKQSGVLAEQRVALGEVLAAGSSIGLIAERGKFWVEARVRENELARIGVGQHATLTVDGGGLGRTMGEVIWVSEAVDPATRMGHVRIRPKLNGNPLYAHQFVDVAIESNPAETAMLVSRDAVQWEGCCNVVFVAETKDRFRPRKVQVQYAIGEQYAIAGLHVGEEIATHGSYLLKTELMKEGLGAGCCGRLE